MHLSHAPAYRVRKVIRTSIDSSSFQNFLADSLMVSHGIKQTASNLPISFSGLYCFKVILGLKPYSASLVTCNSQFREGLIAYSKCYEVITIIMAAEAHNSRYLPYLGMYLGR